MSVGLATEVSVKIKLLAILAFFVFASFAVTVHADNTTCAGAIVLVPDGGTHEGDLTAGGGSRWYHFVAKAGRSYALMLENLTPVDEQREIAAGGLVSTCGGPLVPVNELLDEQEPASSTLNLDLPASLMGAARMAVKVDTDEELFFAVSNIDVSGNAHFRIRVEETTLFNPQWSTEFGRETHYDLLNTTNRPCSVTLDLRNDNNGVPGGSAGPVTFALAGNHSVSRQTGGADLHIHNGQTGHATISHDCTPGAILVDAYLAGGGHERPLKVTAARQQR
jgi:hypothetical protein